MLHPESPMKCNFALCVREKQLILCFLEGCKKSIILSEERCPCVLWT